MTMMPTSQSENHSGTIIHGNPYTINFTLLKKPADGYIGDNLK
jgi:hypothetical protein